MNKDYLEEKRDKKDKRTVPTIMTNVQRLAAGAFIGAALFYSLTSSLNSFFGFNYTNVFYMFIGAFIGMILVKHIR